MKMRVAVVLAVVAAAAVLAAVLLWGGGKKEVELTGAAKEIEKRIGKRVRLTWRGGGERKTVEGRVEEVSPDKVRIATGTGDIVELRRAGITAIEAAPVAPAPSAKPRRVLFNPYREKALRSRCANNLHQTALALIQYAVDHDQELPPRLDDLYGDVYVPSPKLFFCPTSRESGSYVYVSGLLYTDPPNYVVVYEAAGAHYGDGLNVLYVDGHVKWNGDRAASEAQIEKQRREIAARGRTITLIPQGSGPGRTVPPPE